MGIRTNRPYGLEIDGDQGFWQPWNAPNGPLGAFNEPGDLEHMRNCDLGPRRREEFTALELKAGEDELKLLRKIFGVVKSTDGKTTYIFPRHKREYRTKEYLRHRNAFFGSTAEYMSYRSQARAELDADGEALRGQVDPTIKAEKGKKSIREKNPTAVWKASQDVYYSWVRRTYETELKMDPKEVPALIMTGMTPKLRDALKHVRAEYKKPFSGGGNNPRPKRDKPLADDEGNVTLPGGTRLGSLSDHATGTAVDIDAHRNAQLSPTEWKAICGYVKTPALDEKQRTTLWETSPAKLHATIKKINDDFVKKLQEALVAKREDMRAKAAADKSKPQPPAAEKALLALVVRDDEHLKALTTEWLLDKQRYTLGFFNLPWALVELLHKEPMIWGATYKTVDLHHFSLP